ncbi:GyrI-like domain-containing protein [Hoeflea sp. TYP-13]|uniref:GyrI-like domain-containing protein n=1 Tax=Hoeflea sp. TYP-13 TaxID=3230023 RepID=UPI0034C61ABC
MTTTTLPRPSIKKGRALLVAGFRQAYRPGQTANGIPRQWRRLTPYFDSLRNRVGSVAYGLVCSSDEFGNSEYMCGIEVSDFAGLPPELDRLRLPDQTYAVFTHEGHVSTVQRTWEGIWDDWYPYSGYEAADTPDFERYDETFNPETGVGGIEIWFPIVKD